MLFALDLAHLTHPASANEPLGQDRSDDDRRGVHYATQVRWARILADPTVRAGLTDPAPKTRASTIENTTDDMVDAVTCESVCDLQWPDPDSTVEVWRIRLRLWRFSARLTADLLAAGPGAAVTGFEVPLGSAGVA